MRGKLGIYNAQHYLYCKAVLDIQFFYIYHLKLEGTGMNIIAWETTRRCKFSCVHCRASACDNDYAGELSTDEGMKLIDSIAEKSPSLLILTGGEPLLREDIFLLASHASNLKIRVVMAPCGTSINKATIEKLKASGVSRISLSIDGKDSTYHDEFRGRIGAFDEVINAAKIARKYGMEFQINTTVTTKNVNNLEEINDLTKSIGAVIHDVFLLVPTGRGSGLREYELNADKYESTLQWIADETLSGRRNFKVTCAPHYSRIWRQKKNAMDKVDIISKKVRPPSGCLAGNGFVFVSHRGDIQPCGFFDKQCGNIKDFDLNIYKTCGNSDTFNKLSTKSSYKGKCGTCEFWQICKGCRARAFAVSGDFMNEEPYCSFKPKQARSSE